MHLFFLIPLLLGLVTDYIYNKSNEEIAYFMGTATVIFLLISLILAPWELQLALLVFVLITTSKLLRQSKRLI
jgi:uncharacterized protein YqgC (DUF456 family)